MSHADKLGYIFWGGIFAGVIFFGILACIQDRNRSG